jgi:putative DNA methylase
MRKKLIEVALPLEAINAESAREKSIRHGHPSTLHLWWARRPLAACRAVLWASLVDDPSSWPEKFPTEAEQTKERQRLFDILGRITIETDKKGNQKQVVRGLVSWDDIKDEQTINEAQREIARCLAWSRGEEPPTKPEAVRDYIANHAPPVYDPFAGGGSIPLEAQRLGLEAHASDLNPVAVLINKALIEIPPRFKDCPPVNSDDRQRGKLESWKGAQGLAADVRYYGQWMRDEAFQRIGHLYPQVELPEGGKATVIAWIWARTVRCPNPACGCQMPLVRSFQLSKKKGRTAWVEPIVYVERSRDVENDGDTEETKIRFEVRTGEGEIREGTVQRKGARCLACETPVGLDYVRSEGKAKRMSQQLMAVVAESKQGRVYLSPTPEQERIAFSAQPEWKPETELIGKAAVSVPLYGLKTHANLFTPRQLVALTTFSDLVSEVKEKVIEDAINAGLSDDDITLENGGTGVKAYAEAIATYLTLTVDKISDYNSAICSWHSGRDTIRNTFGRQAIPMVWDFAEANPLSDSTGNFSGAINWIIDVIDSCGLYLQGKAYQQDATASYPKDLNLKLISTDPPYYDNICYADLSDFFYVWLRRSLQSIYPDLFRTLLVPKAQELVATPYRFGGDKQKAQDFFEEGLGKAFNQMHSVSDADYPLTVYYAFKQAEAEHKGNGDESIASTGWETMLEGLMEANFTIGGTWPMRTELSNRSIASNSNALASSIVLVCRPRPETATQTTRRQFLSELKRELPKALKTLQQGNIAPVDLAQASIGPGMAIYSQYTAVLENDGSPMPVRTALQLINQILDEFLTEQEGEFDGDTRWALTWFEQYQFNAGQYGDAETLSKAKNTSVQGMVEAGIIEAKAGKVRLLKREELPTDWTPDTNTRMPDWELTQYLIRELLNNGEMGAAELLSKLGDRGEGTRDLAYRLYSLCERKNWAQDAIAYNSLVTAWPEITRLAIEFQSQTSQQTTLDL